MKTSWQLEEEERERDSKSLKFGGGLDVLNQALQGIPGGLEGAIQWMNKGRDWQQDPKNFNKLVNKNPVLKKAWKEFDTGSRQWSGKQLGEVQKGRKALDQWTYSNLDKATGAVKGYNPTGKLSDAFTDIGNMVSGKYGATGPAKNIRDAIQQTRLDDPGQDPDLVRLSGKALTQHLRKFDTPNDRKAAALNTVVTDNRSEPPGEVKQGNWLTNKLTDDKGLSSLWSKKGNNKAQALTKPKPAETGWSTVFTKDPNTGEDLGVMTRNQRKNWERANPKANPKWDEAYTPKSEVTTTPQKIIEKKVKTDEIQKNIEETKDATNKTSIENIGASLLNQTKVGSAYNKVKKIADIAKSLKTVGAGKTIAAGIKGIDPVTIAISLAINAAKQNAEGMGASSGTGYRSIDQGQEYDEWNWA